MDRQKIFKAREVVPASDFMDMQDYIRLFGDDLIRYAIADGQTFGGFTITLNSAFDITVAPGIYLNDGKLYPQRATFQRSLTEFQPLANKVKVAVVVWGTEGEGTPEYRDMVTNIETEATEAQLMNTVNARVAQIGFIKGIESADPQNPSVPLDRIAVGYVTLDPNGVILIEMSTSLDLSSVKKNDQRISVLEAWRTQIGPRIDTIGSDVANLAQRLNGLASGPDLSRIASDVARLKDLSGLPDDYADYGADRFLNTDESALTDPEYLARVEEGIRFNWANQNLSSLQVFNSLNPAITISAGLLLPKFTSEVRLAVTSLAGETSIAQYSQTSNQIVKKEMARQRIRYGQSMNPCTNSAWWQSGRYDPITGIFRINGETWEVAAADRARAQSNHQFVRVTQFWEDNYSESYWDVITSTLTVNGAQVAQTFLNTQAGWLTGVDLYFTKRGPSGNVNVTLCELTESGTPNIKKAIYTGTLNWSDIKVGEFTQFSLMPTFLEAGKRYGVVLITNGDHYVGMASGGDYLAGTFFYSTDGSYFAGDLTKDMMFGLRFGKFASSRVVVDMQPLNLDGGITDIDLIASMVTPEATGVTFQVQVNNQWVTLSQLSLNAFIGLPPLLPLQAVFQGTPDLHSGILLTGSQVKVSRPRTDFKHISTPRLLPAPTSTVRVTMSLGNWNGTRHTCGMVLKHAGGTTSPSVVTDENLGNGRIARTWRFAPSSAISSFQMVTTGTTTTAIDEFLVEERVDIEF